MGANGSFASGATSSELGRKYKTIGIIGNIQVVTPKNSTEGIKLPEESHTPNKMYATFYKDGHDIKAIAKFGPDGKKLWEIHTVGHKDLGAHYHEWKNGRPISDKPLTKAMLDILDKVRNYKP